MLDFRIYTFIVVCKYMNYTKAAEELHITQPAVSQHIKYIENDYNIKLFEFEGKKIKLTTAGERLLNVATTLKHDDIFLREYFDELKNGKRKLNFGVTLTIGEFVIADYVSGYIKKYPNTEVRVTISNTEQLLDKLDTGEIDFAIVEGFFDKGKYDSMLFRKEQFVAVCGQDIVIDDSSGVTWDSIYENTLVSREEGSGTREILERTLAENNSTIKEFNNIIEIGNINAIKQIVANNCGIAFLYEAAVKDMVKTGKLRIINIKNFDVSHNFTYIWRKNSIFGAQHKELFEQMTQIVL